MNQKLSSSEIESNFSLDFYSLDELEEAILLNKTDDLRDIYFTKELLSVLYFINEPKNLKIRIR